MSYKQGESNSSGKKNPLYELSKEVKVVGNSFITLLTYLRRTMVPNHGNRI